MSGNEEIFFYVANQSDLIKRTLLDIGVESQKRLKGLKRAQNRCIDLVNFSTGLKRIIQDRITDLEKGEQD